MAEQTTQTIGAALAEVEACRARAEHDPALAQALGAIKRWQSQRFAHTYADLLDSPIYSGCARFFLDELYGTRDFSQRDAQFARIAGPLERRFPAAVADTAATLAQLHAVTEQLDLDMAQQWMTLATVPVAQRYAQAWKAVGCATQRQWQLATVLELGRSLGQLTRKKGLRVMLRLMRKPAELAGLGALQLFLESGFDHFSTIAAEPAHLTAFLETIEARESQWMAALFA
ncbi:MAG: hypothetical protein Fur007_02590 [Rhodoferax sp.]